MQIKYNYELISGVRSKSELERDPPRTMEVCPPSSVSSSPQKTTWTNTNRCLIVNGIVEKQDGNFLKEFFITKIEKSGIYVGSYPHNESCIK